MAKRHLDLGPLSSPGLDQSKKRMSLDLLGNKARCFPPPTSLHSNGHTSGRLLAKQRMFQAKHGGFLDFQASHPSLCETKSCCPISAASSSTSIPRVNSYKYMTSLSQPCLPVTNEGPTKILPYLYLGSQQDALTEETIQKNGISYILNVSTTCPRPQYIAPEHFLRIPVNDNHCDKLQPFFEEAFHFLDKVREANGRVMVHCLAGISRSPTLAIAYIMRHLKLSTDEAYKYVKEKRPTISPNFNFMGQLLAYENHLKETEASFSSSSITSSTSSLVSSSSSSSTVVSSHTAALPQTCYTGKGLPSSVSMPSLSITPAAKHNTSEESVIKKQCLMEVCSSNKAPQRSFKPFLFPAVPSSVAGAAQSPTSALAKLSFGATQAISPLVEENSFPSFPTTSLDQVVPIPCLTSNKRHLAEHNQPTVHHEQRATKRANVQRPKSIAILDEQSEQQPPQVSNDGLESSRRSRSLEDILAAADDCLGGAAPSADVSFGGKPLDQCRTLCEHQSNSSISSSGGSIHGSLELIQVL